MSVPAKVRAGVARANITPGVGVDLCGFAGRGVSVGVLDDLYATALVLDDGRRRVAILHLDLIGVEGVWARRASEQIGRQGRLPAGDVLLCCTHTHYGPTTHAYDKDSATSAESAYMAELRFKLAGVVEQARRKLDPVVARVGRSTSDIGINRRERLPDGRIILGHNPGGRIDREVIVVRLDRLTGEPLACLLNFAAHPVSQGGQARLISADFPGPAREVVEQLTGSVCLYLQGACGNINSVIMRKGAKTPRTLGKRLGAAAVQAYEVAEPVRLGPIGIATQQVKLPAKTHASAAEARRAVEELEREVAHLTEARAHRGSLQWANMRLERAQAALDSLEGGRPLSPVEGGVWGVLLGDVGMATGPGEIFCEIGLAVKQGSPFPHTMYVSNANGSIGYVPIPEAYPEGGYEVTHASRVGPEAAGLLVEASLRVLRRARSLAHRGAF